MTHKRAILRGAADRDVQEAIDFYLTQNASQAALQFIDALEQALHDIERHPGIGSLRYAHELDLPGLRCWRLHGYPHVLFHVEHGITWTSGACYTAVVIFLPGCTRRSNRGQTRFQASPS